MVMTSRNVSIFRRQSLSSTKLYTLTLTALLVATSCGRRAVDVEPSHRDNTPMVTATTVTPEGPVAESVPKDQQRQANEALIFVDSTAVAAAATAASEHVSGKVTLKKSEIFDRTFLYGFDLQYSATGDARLSLLNQSQALGHVPATFRQLGGKLQLVSDNRRLFESEVNHPETLINEYKIVSETDTELTITMDSPGMLLHKSVNGPEAKPPLKTWLRSIDYVADGNYLLQESAIMLENGEVQTYMESLFPRETLVPKDYVGIEDNRDKNPDSARFMLIGNEKVFVERKKTNGVPVRQQTQFANRFRLASDTATIDWYVTPNIPDDFIKEVRSGVEGWNRYFHDELGRDVMVFKGRLPANVKLGDPRYNIINFDSVAQAGAAYESQASDPLTGIQSHSIVYMPYAWYNIAAKLSASRETPDMELSSAALIAKIGPKSPETLFGQPHNVLACAREAGAVSAGPSQTVLVNAATDEERKKIVDDFGRRVFISTLFHEIGHALGLGHNFKGSLAFDAAKPIGPSNETSYSVMDYNYYQHEIDLFHEIGGVEGPKLEYDRQALSFLYNSSKNIKPSDPKIAACNDDDADGVDGGVDFACIRYDAETNPILGLEHAIGRFANLDGAIGIDKLTLTQALVVQKDRLTGRLGDAVKVPDAKAAEKVVAQATADLASVIGYYLADGAQSMRVNITLNAGALRNWSSDPSEDGIKMSETEMRSKYVKALAIAASEPSLPASAADVVKRLKALVTAAITQTERFGTQADRAALAAKMSESIDASVEKALTEGFAKVRTGVAPKLATGAGVAPFASFAVAGKSMEQIAVESLAKMTTVGLTSDKAGSPAVLASHINTAKILAAYAKLGDDYADTIKAVKASLTTIRNDARQGGHQEALDQVRAIINVLP